MIKLHIIANNQCGVMLAQEDCEIRNWRENDALWAVLKKKYSQAYCIYMYCGRHIVGKYCKYAYSRKDSLRKLAAKGKLSAKDLWKLQAGLI